MRIYGKEQSSQLKVPQDTDKPLLMLTQSLAVAHEFVKLVIRTRLRMSSQYTLPRWRIRLNSLK
jgi:hypothetical protein